MSLEIWVSFAVFTLCWSLVPGPSIGFTIAYSIRHGFARTTATIGGQLAANAVQILAVSVGLSRLLEVSATAFFVLKMMGVAYLVYLGIRQWCAKPLGDASNEQIETVSGRTWRDAGRGFVVCAANPKALLYFAAILPQFVSSGGDRAIQLLLLGATNLLIGAFVMLLYAAAAERARGWLAARCTPRLRNRVAGGMMLAAAAYLAVGRRS